ncbi:hypothetical protein [Chitinimonas sp. BJYL2]|uniref:DUF5983 family protein n=1 Tax=Chitinimonas sp. BJYL2 TaxID=2976696 RepID=UPI0022B40054|nr:hypothetical protein [Chitinimonas sp. BJYL2]
MAHTWLLIVPILSTAHLQPCTLDWLQAHAQTAPYREGVFVNMMSFTASDHPEELSALQEWLAFVYPDENWIRFDADGDVIDTLPTFDAE